MPTDTELFAFDAQWSEHCSYKSSRNHLRKLPTDGPTVMQGPAEDAGILHLGEWNGERYGVVIAHESHNHPSQVVPFEGAATGIGGIVRDVLCMGAEVIALADPLRFGRLDDPHCRYVAQSVVDGIAAYGNAIGVPNLGGDVYVDESFDDNVLVNVVALGLVKEHEIIHSKAPPDAVGWDIVLVGKATDRSGFGGASFSSLTLDEADAESNKGAVQVPDPFLKNVIMRASYQRLRRAAAARGSRRDSRISAPAGSSAAAPSCALRAGSGAEVELDRIPLAQADLPPAVIAIGETQERLCWIVPPSFTPQLLAIYNEEYGAAADRARRGGGDRRQGRRGGPLPRAPSRRGGDGRRPRLPHRRRTLQPAVHRRRRPTAAAPGRAAVRGDRGSARRGCSRTATSARGARSTSATTASCAARPPSRSATPTPGVIVPIPGAPLGVALAVAGNPRYGKLDPQLAAEHAVVEAVRNVVAVGARPLGLTDCLNFGDPTVPEHLGAHGRGDRRSRVRRARARRRRSSRATSVSTTSPSRAVRSRRRRSSPASARSTTSRAASPGAQAAPDRRCFFVGAFDADLGGSVYADVARAARARRLPRIDYDRVERELALLAAAYRENLVLAAHDVSDGGLLVALAKMAFATRDGARIGIEVDTFAADAEAGPKCAIARRPAVSSSRSPPAMPDRFVRAGAR